MSGTSTVIQPCAIEIDDSLQPRAGGLSEQHVLALVETPEAWPPILLARDGQALVLLDGFHRLEAAKRLGLDSIPATIRDAPADGDYFRLAFEANAAHGRALDLKDRKGYANRLLRENPDLSDREIGRRAGLNHETVGALRRGVDSSRGVADRRPGELPDLSLIDPLRFARATRPQKAIAGYLKRLATALEDPYEDEMIDWDSEPVAIAQACFAAMGPDRATILLQTIEADASFIARVGAARSKLSAQRKEK